MLKYLKKFEINIDEEIESRSYIDFLFVWPYSSGPVLTIEGLLEKEVTISKIVVECEEAVTIAEKLPHAIVFTNKFHPTLKNHKVVIDNWEGNLHTKYSNLVGSIKQTTGVARYVVLSSLIQRGDWEIVS